MATLDKEPIVDGFEAVASPAAANEATIKTEQEDDGIVIATPSESWVLLDSKSDDEEVIICGGSRRQLGLSAGERSRCRHDGGGRCEQVRRERAASGVDGAAVSEQQ